MTVSPARAPRPWEPDYSPEDELSTWCETYPISDDVYYVQRLEFDPRNRLSEWAVIQMRGRVGNGRQVALYDTCHGKGVHVHYYDQHRREVEEVRLRPISSYQELEAGLDYALDRVSNSWEENERRAGGWMR
jgi:hypothetical protein